jgi:hypothetical protein
MALCGFIGGAHATTYGFSENSYVPVTNVNAPLYFTVLPNDQSPTFVQNVSGSIGGVERSPYELNNNGNAGAFYSVLAPGGQVGSATATYNFVAGTTVFALLWGSPDTYNNVAFFNGPDGTGGQIGSTLAGSNLACYPSNCTQLAWDVVTFTASGGTFGSVVLTDTGQAAFEFGLRVGTNQGETPLPAAFWLFGTVIAGTAGASRMRRRRRQLQLA